MPIYHLFLFFLVSTIIEVHSFFLEALMYDEKSKSFRWLFDTLLQAHNNKKPKTILTDQDRAMARELADVMPETQHGLCT
jgi:hypothetical protein